jgi:two-component system sensor histidine kinase PilS (NtrC family)
VADCDESERRLKLFIYARIAVSSLLLVSTVFLKSYVPFDDFERHQPGMIRLMALSFVFSVLSLLILKKIKYTSFQAYLQVIWDLLFVTIFVLFTGGTLSPYSFLYIFSIMIAGMLLGRQQALYTASLCGILYGAMMDFQYFGYFSFIGLTQEDAQQFGAIRLLYTISSNLIAFSLTAFITGLSAERAQLSEEALHKTAIDYTELTHLSSAIVAHSESGILTTTVSGRIRVFNPYAESVSGLRQVDVYDKPVREIFPYMPLFAGQVTVPVHGEFKFVLVDSQEIILGFRVAQFTDSNDNLTGYIVNFRDITEMRRMEEALKRADRLAAVGELSARMAHEIRNPLASLCGSVQLLSTNSDMKESDKRLLTIVTREAERLESLISEFLLYARPTAPQIKVITIHSYLDELLLFIANDPRFKHIVLKNLIEKKVTIYGDPDQIRQVIINLFHNAADAMPDGGTIVIESKTSPEIASLLITDDGSGISENAAQHLFEPFWTTKPAGTGLGLAISYRIMQAHGGTLSVESVEKQGSRFIMTFPVLPQSNSLQI